MTFLMEEGFLTGCFFDSAIMPICPIDHEYHENVLDNKTYTAHDIFNEREIKTSYLDVLYDDHDIPILKFQWMKTIGRSVYAETYSNGFTMITKSKNRDDDDLIDSVYHEICHHTLNEWGHPKRHERCVTNFVKQHHLHENRHVLV